MSIFNSGSGFNSLPWLQEKTLRALQAAARLVDVAAEPDTMPWYGKMLRGAANDLIGQLAPVVALLYGARQDAASGPAVSAILEKGSFGLARWCREWDIVDPVAGRFETAAGEWDEADRQAKAEEPSEESADREFRGDLPYVKIQLLGYLARRLHHDEMPGASRSLLLWLMQSLAMSGATDTCSVSRRFLPGDIGHLPDQTAAAYRDLFERGLVLPADPEPDDRDDTLRLRLVEPGLNDPKHPPGWREEVFGFPGSHIGGQLTRGNVLQVDLPEATGAALRWWAKEDGLAGLADHLTEALGRDRVFIQELEVRGQRGEAVMDVRLRQVRGLEDAGIRGALEAAVPSWLRQNLVSPDPPPAE